MNQQLALVCVVALFSVALADPIRYNYNSLDLTDSDEGFMSHPNTLKNAENAEVDPSYYRYTVDTVYDTGNALDTVFSPLPDDPEASDIFKYQLRNGDDDTDQSDHHDNEFDSIIVVFHDKERDWSR